VPSYVRFCCARQYTATTALGEEVAVLDQRRDPAAFAGSSGNGVQLRA
jgi:hypothetical protein